MLRHNRHHRLPMPPTTLPLSATDIADIERATLDAVAPREVDTLDGWLLPFDESTIGRAKSAVPLRHQGLRTTDLPRIAERYTQKQLPAAFRIADTPGLASLHAELAELGYTAQQPTLVQIGSVKGLRQLTDKEPAAVAPTPDAPWAEVYSADGFDPVDGQSRAQALSRSPQAVYATLMDGDHAVAAGTACFSQGWASLHGIRTVAHARGRGLASRVLTGLAQAAAARGLQRVFLQVEENNTAAIALYQRAGFITAWRYHYWRQPQAACGLQHC
jgi:ribosomal protein S18 acetylase RimI-like enzyme